MCFNFLAAVSYQTITKYSAEQNGLHAKQMVAVRAWGKGCCVCLKPFTRTNETALIFKKERAHSTPEEIQEHRRTLELTVTDHERHSSFFSYPNWHTDTFLLLLSYYCPSVSQRISFESEVCHILRMHPIFMLRRAALMTKRQPTEEVTLPELAAQLLTVSEDKEVKQFIIRK